MLNQFLASLAHFLPRTPAAPCVLPWINEDSNWHNSSYELSRGLVVIEDPSAQLVGFDETLPAFQRAQA